MYFYTDISVISVTFRNSGLRSKCPIFSPHHRFSYFFQCGTWKRLKMRRDAGRRSWNIKDIPQKTFQREFFFETIYWKFCKVVKYHYRMFRKPLLIHYINKSLSIINKIINKSIIIISIIRMSPCLSHLLSASCKGVCHKCTAITNGSSISKEGSQVSQVHCNNKWYQY